MIQTRNDIKAFHGDQAIKDKYLARVRAHRKADEIIHGSYVQIGVNDTFKGCAVGCTLHSGRHWEYESELGIPTQLAFIQDGLFERMSKPDDVLFPEQFLEAIPVGADLYPAYWKFMIWVLTDETNGLLPLVEDAEVKTIIGQVVALYQKAIDGKDVTDEEFYKVRGAARAALDALAALAALDARAARALKYRDKLLECLREVSV